MTNAKTSEERKQEIARERSERFARRKLGPKAAAWAASDANAEFYVESRLNLKLGYDCSR